MISVDYRGRSIACVLVLGSAMIVAAGCASLSADPEIARAAADVGTRTAVSPTWLSEQALPSPPADGAWAVSEHDAVLLALAKDTQVLSGIERVRAARADLVQAGLLPNPILSLELAFPVAGEDGGTKVAAGLTTQLAHLLTRDRRVSVADAELTATVLELSDRALQVAAAARRAHAEVRFARAKLQPSRNAVAALERSVEVARTQLQAGENTVLAVNRQSRALLDTQRLVKQRESDLRKAEHTLLEVVGHADYMGEVDAVNSNPFATAAGIDERAAVTLAESRRLDVAAAKALAEAARRQAGLDKVSLWADTEAGAAFERDTDRKELGPVVSVPIPIFDMGQARGAKAAAVARMAELAADGVRNRAISEVRTAWTDLNFAREYLERVRSDLLALATQSVQSAQSSVASGQADTTVVLEAESLLATVQLEILDAEERLALAQIELERAMGGRGVE